MPPRARTGRRAGTWAERPLDNPKPYPGTLERWEREHQEEVRKRCLPRNPDNPLEAKLLYFHDWDSRRNSAGFPDTFVAGPGGLLVRELKRDSDGRVSDAQVQWIEALAAAGVDAGVWWMPRDLQSGRVDNELNRLRRPLRPGPDLIEQTAKLMFLATTAATEIPGAALHWDAGTRTVNRSLWRKEARLLLHGVAASLPLGGPELTTWLRVNRLQPDASPAEVLRAVRLNLTRHVEEADVAAG